MLSEMDNISVVLDLSNIGDKIIGLTEVICSSVTGELSDWHGCC